MTDVSSTLPELLASADHKNWANITELARAAPGLTTELTQPNLAPLPSESNLPGYSSDWTPGERESSRVRRKREEIRSKTQRLPDLRFEQSYRRSISEAHGVWWKVILITIKDQMCMPLIQGFLMKLALAGVKSWRISAAAKGNSWGGKYFYVFLYNSNSFQQSLTSISNRKVEQLVGQSEQQLYLK